jgi:hypothetical protein
MRKFTKRSAALVTAGVVAVSGGAAYAAWLLGGGGTASATASTAQGLTLLNINTGSTTDDVEVSPAFFPGSTNNVKFTVVNQNPFPVKINTIVLTVGASDKTGCDASNVTVTGSALPAPEDLVVPAKAAGVNGTKEISYVGALSMPQSAVDPCQGAVFPITVTLGANSGTTAP